MHLERLPSENKYPYVPDARNFSLEKVHFTPLTNSLCLCWCICEPMYRGPSRDLCIGSIYPTLLGLEEDKPFLSAWPLLHSFIMLCLVILLGRYGV